MTDEDTANALGHTAKEELDRTRRRLSRQVGAALLSGMAATDANIWQMAIKIGQSENWVRERVDRLVDGKSIPLNHVSDLFFSMGLDVGLSLSRRDDLPQPIRRQIEEQAAEPRSDDATMQPSEPA